MTARGDGRLFRSFRVCPFCCAYTDRPPSHRSPTPKVKIGLTITISSPILESLPSSPFRIVVTARILASPNTQSPITLATHLNALGDTHNRSFNNIVCTSPKTATHKCIEIWPRGWPHYVWDPDDLRDSWEFVTVPVDGNLEVRHKVSRVEIAETGLNTGERHKISLTDKCLGTRWIGNARRSQIQAVERRRGDGRKR